MRRFLVAAVTGGGLLWAWALGGRVVATVGGPTYISEIAYDHLNSAVYYLKNDHSGMGCPPVVHKIDLVNNQDKEVKTCEEVLREYYADDSGGNERNYRQFTSDLYKGLSYIGSVSLKKNNIKVRVSHVSEHVVDNEKLWAEFQATITQDNKELAKINFRGCHREQPHTFEGYMIPNSDVMVMLISNKGDCLEGGYVKESVHIVKGVKYYDMEVVRGFKEAGATEPNLGNLVVAAGEGNGSRSKNVWGAAALGGAAVFVGGVWLGYLAGRRARFWG